MTCWSARPSIVEPDPGIRIRTTGTVDARILRGFQTDLISASRQSGCSREVEPALHAGVVVTSKWSSLQNSEE